MLKYTLIIFCLLLISPCFSQVKGEREFQECELIFKDSTSFEGLCRITKKEKIEFKMEGDSIVDVWDHKDVKSVRFFRSNYDQILEYWSLRKNKNPYLLEILREGEAILYARKTFRMFAKSKKHPAEGGYGVKFGKKEVIIGYFLKKKNETQLTTIKLSWSYKTWKKRIKEFFKDCPYLVENLENDGYDKKYIKELVQDYNVYCFD
jgi:hypothetical protein